VSQLTQAEAHTKSVSSRSVPRWVGAYAEKVNAARGRPERMKRVFDRSAVPMLLIDGERRYVDANPPARLSFRQSLAELKQLRIEDLTPCDFLPAMQEAWLRLLSSGVVAGLYDVASPEGTHMEVSYYAMADALPGLHLIAFAPSGWPEDELVVDAAPGNGGPPRLTPRESEILQLAADGYSGPMIASELVVSTATVRTHFEHIYEKLSVRDRAAAVAKAMRLGLIV